ncbi:MAG: C39 family peptidase [Ignavibacteriales bacterium]|nr:C39 family peptidase [Ignavibacteriales bacterium]
MFTHPSRLITTVIASTILFPIVLLSQVKIKEKVEIKPSAVAASIRSAASVAQSHDFFHPPLFVWDTIAHQPYLTLSSHVTVQGAVTFGLDADVVCGEQAQLVVYLTEYRQDAFAWKGRYSSGAGCGKFEDKQPFVGDFSQGGYPDVQMYLFDWQWADAARKMSGDDNTISYLFKDSLRQGIESTSPWVTVTGTAIATGSALPEAQFNHWELRDNQTDLTCNGSMPIRMYPTDGYDQPYAPVGISGSGAPVTVSVEGGGPYVFLRALGQEGTPLTTTLSDGCTLVFDADRGGFSGDTKVVIVTVSGGGASGSFPVTLHCNSGLDHFLVTATPTVLSQGMYSKLTVIAQDSRNHEVFFPDGPKFDVTLSLSSLTSFFWWFRWGPPPLGSLVVGDGSPPIQSVQVPYDTARAGRVSYFVESDILARANVDSMIVAIRAERVDDASKNGMTQVKVVKSVVESTCVLVAFDTSVVSVGGSTGLQFTRADGTGGFSADQLFKVIIVSGGGALVSSTDSGTVLASTKAPVRYVAPATIVGDSMVVGVSALAFSSGGGAPAGLQVSVDSILNGPAPKKMPKAATVQSLSKKAWEAQMEAIAKLLADSQCPMPAKAVVTSNKKRIPTSIKLNPDRTTLVPRDLLYLYVVLKDANGEIDATKNETDARIDFSVGSEFEKFGELHRTDTIGPPGMILTGVKYGPPAVLDCDKLAYDERFPLRVNVSASVSHNETINDVKTIEVVGSHTVGRYFNQGNTDWSTDTLDSYVLKKKGTQIDSVNDAGNLVYGTIQNAGCTMSCIAMVLKAFGCDVDPRKLNVWMKENPPSFASGNNGNIGDWIKILLEYPGSTVGPTMEVGRGLKWEGGTLVKPAPAYTAPLEYNLSLGYPSIVQIVNRHSDGRETAHWVLVTGKTLAGQYTILDPGDKAHVTLDPDSTPIYKYREIVRR